MTVFGSFNCLYVRSVWLSWNSLQRIIPFPIEFGSKVCRDFAQRQQGVVQEEIPKKSGVAYCLKYTTFATLLFYTLNYRKASDRTSMYRMTMGEQEVSRLN